MFGTSNKTTILGICTILSALIGVVTGIVNGTPVDWTSAVSMFLAGLGLIFGKDFNVTGGTKTTP